MLGNFNWNILEERNNSESTSTLNEQNSIKKLPNEGETTLRWKSQMEMKVVVKRAVKKNEEFTSTEIKGLETLHETRVALKEARDQAGLRTVH